MAIALTRPEQNKQNKIVWRSSCTQFARTNARDAAKLNGYRNLGTLFTFTRCVRRYRLVATIQFTVLHSSYNTMHSLANICWLLLG